MILETLSPQLGLRFESALELCPEGFCILDREWRYRYFNQSWLELKKLKDNPPLETRIWDVFPHLLNTDFHSNFRKVMEEGSTVRFEYFSKAADAWLEISAYPLPDGMAYTSRDVSDRVQARKEARTWKARLDSILEGVNAGVIAHDADGKCVYINDQGAQMCGYSSASELLKHDMAKVRSRFELCDESGDPIDHLNLPAALIRKGVMNPPEVVVQYRSREQAQTRWCILKSKPIFEDGKLQLIVTIFSDYTDRKRMQLENELFLSIARTERGRLEAVIKQVEMGVLIIDADSGQSVFMNDKIKEIWRADSIPKDNFSRYTKFQAYRLDGSHVKENEWPSYRVLRHGVAIKDEEYEIVRFDGTRGFAKFSAFPIRNDKGVINAVLITLADVTDIRKQERAAQFIAESGRILSSSLDYSETLKTVAKLAVPTLADWCSITIVENGVVQDLAVAHQDPKMLTLAEEFRRKYPTDLNSSGMGEVFRSGLAKLVPTVTHEMLAQVARSPEHLQMMLALKIHSIVYVPVIAGEEVLGVLALIGSNEKCPLNEIELKIAEKLGRRAGQAIFNSRLFERAQQAVKSRDSLISVSAHELLTPISGSKLQMQIMRKRMSQGIEITPEMVRKMVDQTERQLDRLNRLVSEMLDLSRINLGKLTVQRTETCLSTLVCDLSDRMAGQLQSAQCVLELDVEPGVKGSIDSYRIEQVLSNLLSNAARYARGSSVTVRLKKVENLALLSVEDRGIGIRKEDQERVFKRFERAATIDEGSGLGLGLFVVKQIVEAHQGSVSLESEFGKGSKFTVELPLNETNKTLQEGCSA